LVVGTITIEGMGDRVNGVRQWPQVACPDAIAAIISNRLETNGRAASMMRSPIRSSATAKMPSSTAPSGAAKSGWGCEDAREPHRSFLRLPHGRLRRIRDRKVGAVMGVFSEYDLILKEVSKAMADQPAPVQLEYRLDRLVAELDELCALANQNPSQFEPHMIAVGQTVSRAQILAGFILGRPYPTHRLVGRA
jgi:hypothetical protein